MCVCVFYLGLHILLLKQVLQMTCSFFSHLCCDHLTPPFTLVIDNKKVHHGNSESDDQTLYWDIVTRVSYRESDKYRPEFRN